MKGPFCVSLTVQVYSSLPTITLEEFIVTIIVCWLGTFKTHALLPRKLPYKHRIGGVRKNIANRGYLRQYEA